MVNGEGFGEGKGFGEGEGFGEGVSAPQRGGVVVGAVPPPQNFLNFYPEMAHFLCILLMTGGMAPPGPHWIRPCLYCTRRGMCSYQLTDVNDSDHVHARQSTACGADRRVVEYLPSSKCSQLPERLVHFHLHFTTTNSTTVYDVQ